MTTNAGTIEDAKVNVREAVREAAPWIEGFARFGYVAKGLVYVIVGALSAMAAIGAGGRTTGSNGAMHTILEQPFGKVLLGVVAFGLLCFGLWQVLRAVEDPDRVGCDVKGCFKRVNYFGSGLLYFLLVAGALKLIFLHVGGDGTGDANAKSWTATIMAYPFGRLVVGAIGISIAIYGLFNLFFAHRAQLQDQVMLERMGTEGHRWARIVGRFGIAARGIVFILIGWFFIAAAYHLDAARARGIGGALAAVEQQSYGPAMLGIVAVGLIAYGVFQFILARYRVIRTPGN